MRGRTWVVKSNVKTAAWAQKRDDSYRETPVAAEEEFAVSRDNPHGAILARAFAIAGIEFGRADYGVIGGRAQIYEINTNPNLPGPLKMDAGAPRRIFNRAKMFSAIKALDTPIGASGRVQFSEARPRAHTLHLPRWRLPLSLCRRTLSLFAARTRI